MFEISNNFVALRTIVYREIHRFMRIWPQTLLPSSVSMTLYFVIFGGMIGGQIRDMAGRSYMEFIVPGLIMMAIITNSYNNVVASFYGAKFHRSIEEMMVAPVSPHTIVIGYAFGGVLRGVVVGGVVTVVSMFFTKLTIYHAGITLFVTLVTSSIFSLCGFINAVFARNYDDVSIIPNFVLTPLIYLGGVFYSVDLLSPWWRSVSLFNPILHMVGAFRYGFLGVSDINIQAAVWLMVITALVLYLICVRLLASGLGIRH